MEIVFNLLIVLLLVVIIAGIVGLVKPKLYKKVLGKKATRKHIALYSVGLFVVVFVAIGISEPASVKQARLEKERQAQLAKDEQQKQAQQVQEQPVEEKKEEPQNTDPRYYWHEVTKVVDGDTVKARVDGKEESIRIIGIDSPESTKSTECFGAEASNKAKELLEGKWIQLESDNSQSNRDKYDRLLRFVWLDNNTDFGKRMIEEGYAHEYTYSVPYNKQAQYKEAYEAAKNGKKGLWSPDTCNGQDQKPAPQTQTNTTPSTSNAAPAPAPTPAPSSSGVVKKSSTGICHAPGTTYYDRTTNFTPYDSLDACLASGGRLPKR